jgi:hypothetical protein
MAVGSLLACVYGSCFFRVCGSRHVVDTPLKNMGHNNAAHLHPVLCLQALEKDLADLKARAESADALQQQLEGAKQQLQAHGSEQAGLQQELSQCRSRIAELEFDLHGELRATCCSCAAAAHFIACGPLLQPQFSSRVGLLVHLLCCCL